MRVDPGTFPLPILPLTFGTKGTPDGSTPGFVLGPEPGESLLFRPR